MRLNRLFPAKRSHAWAGAGSDAPVVELDRWQLTGLLFGMLVIAVAAFFVGRSAGLSAQPKSEPASVASLARVLSAGATSRERQIALAEVWPPTSGIDQGLSRPIEPPLPSDPTERARAQAHIQLQEARSMGLRDDAPPMLAGGASAPTVTPQMATNGKAGYTLQISLFDTQAAAQVIAAQLETTGSAVRIRQVRTTDMRDLFRVEVGDFSSSEAALAFQRRFERDTGYSGVLITL